MRRALTAAMKARDQPAVTALRSALAAIDNAEAVDTPRATPAAQEHPSVAGDAVAGETAAGGVAAGDTTDSQGAGGGVAGQESAGGVAAGRVAAGGEVAGGGIVGGGVAGAVVGLGAAEVERRTLTSAQMEAIVRWEVAERQTAARAYERAGRSGHAERLRAEAEVLSAYLGDPGVELGDPGVELGDSGVDLGDPDIDLRDLGT